jgi:hypothetical protein
MELDELLRGMSEECRRDYGAEGFTACNAFITPTHVILNRRWEHRDSLNNEWQGYSQARVERAVIVDLLKMYTVAGSIDESVPSLNAIYSSEKAEGRPLTETKRSDYTGTVRVRLSGPQLQMRYWFEPSAPESTENK